MVYLEAWYHMLQSGDSSLAHRLGACPVFTTVPAERLAAVLQRYRYRLETYEAGAVVAFRGDRYERLMVLLTGSVRTEMNSYSGQQYTVAEYNAPCLLAPALLFGEENVIPVSVTTIQPSQLLRVSRTAVLHLCRNEQAFLEAYLGDISTRVGVLADKLRLTRFGTIRERVAHYLLDQYQLQGTPTLQLPHSRRTQAEILGATRPALSRVLSELAEAGVITYDRDILQIQDIVALERLADEVE